MASRSISFRQVPSVATSINSQKSEAFIEPLLDPSHDRPHLLPIIHHDFWNMYQLAKASFWVPEEVDLAPDMSEWDSRLTANEKIFMELNLAFFAVFDQIVIKNLDQGFIDKISIPEVKSFLHFQDAMEDIHVQMYSIMMEVLVKDPERKEYLLNAVKTVPAIKAMAEWASDSIKNDWTNRLVRFIIVEGLFFSGAFASIFFMKKQGKLLGVAHANELIARDEGMHRDFGLLLYSKLVRKLPDQEIIAIMDEAVALTTAFNSESLSVDMIGMNQSLMGTYIKYVANGLALGTVSGGLEIPGLLGRKIYEAENPFPWMNMVNLQGKTNFFDAKVSQYCKASVLTKPEDNTIVFSEDF